MYAVVRDKARNMQLSSRILKEKSQETDQFESVSCNGHRLQLCLKNGLSTDVIDRMVKCSSKLVRHFKQSGLATNE